MISTINTLQYPYLQDKEFLKKIDNCNYRTEFTRIELLDFKTEQTIENIETEVINGSININGDSAMRRTANLTVLIKEQKYKNNIEDYLQLNKKIKIIKSIENPFPEEYPQYPQLIDFPQGVFVIYEISFSHSTDSVTASLTLHDKMALLNGECGGTIPAAVNFQQKEKANGDITVPTIKQNIMELVNHFGEESLSNIHIYDIEDFIKVPIVWVGGDCKLENYKQTIKDDDTPEEKARKKTKNAKIDKLIPILDTDNNLYIFIYDFPAINSTYDHYVNDLTDNQWLSKLSIPQSGTQEFIDYCNNFWKTTRTTREKFYWKQYPWSDTIIDNIVINEYYSTAQRWNCQVDTLFHRYQYLYELLYPTEYKILEPKIIANKAVKPYEYFGYSFNSFTFPGELTCQPGDTVTSVLDKIKNQLGNYEYFYDVFGNFVFQEIKNYSNNSFVNSKDAQKCEYQFQDNIIQSISTNFDVSKLKNDFLIWGVNKNNIPIRYHAAIDQVGPIQKDIPIAIQRLDGLSTLYITNKIEDKDILNYTGFGNDQNLQIDLLPGYYYWNWKENNSKYNKFKQDLGLKKERLSTKTLKQSWTFHRYKTGNDISYFNFNAHNTYTLKIPMERTYKPTIKYSKQNQQGSNFNDFPNKLTMLNIGDYQTLIPSSSYGGRKYFYWGTDEWFECNENTNWAAQYTTDEEVTLSENIRYEKYRFKIHGSRFISVPIPNSIASKQYIYQHLQDEDIFTPRLATDSDFAITVVHIKNPLDWTESDIANIDNILHEKQWYFWFAKDKQEGSAFPYIPNGEIQIGRWSTFVNVQYEHYQDDWTFIPTIRDKGFFRSFVMDITAEGQIEEGFHKYEYLRLNKVHIDYKVKYYSGDKPEYARDGYDNRNADGTLVKGMTRIYNNVKTCVTDYVNHTTIYFQHPQWDASGFGTLNTNYYDSLHNSDTHFDEITCSDTPFNYNIGAAINPAWAAYHQIGKFYYYESQEKRDNLFIYRSNLYWGQVVKKYPRTVYTNIATINGVETESNYEVTPILFKPGGQFKFLPFYQLTDPQYPVFAEANSTYNIFDNWDYKDEVIIKPLKQDIKDYRQALYVEGLLKEPTGIEKSYYYPQLKNEWYHEEKVEKEIVQKEDSQNSNKEKQTYTDIQINYLYDIFNDRFPLQITEHPQDIKYFLDILDSEKLAHFNVDSIGRKTLIIKDDSINCIFEPEPPSVMYFTKQGLEDYTYEQAEKNVKEKIKDYAARNGLTYVNLTEDNHVDTYWTIKPIRDHFTFGTYYNSAYERFRGELAYYISLSSQISLTTVPIYYLEPNIRIRLNSQQDQDLNSDYIIKSISLPLGADGNMSLSCSKVFERI